MLIKQTYSYKLHYYVFCILQSKLKQFFSISHYRAGEISNAVRLDNQLQFRQYWTSFYHFYDLLTFASFVFLPHALHLSLWFAIGSCDHSVHFRHCTVSFQLCVVQNLFCQYFGLFVPLVFFSWMGNFSFSLRFSYKLCRDVCVFVRTVVLDLSFKGDLGAEVV
jgi:hypothetical protein